MRLIIPLKNFLFLDHIAIPDFAAGAMVIIFFKFFSYL
jgi:hypothetical protein